MNYPIDFKEITTELEFYQEVVRMHNEAKEYLNSFRWCKRIEKSSLYYNLGSKICLFLVKIQNSDSVEDNYLWVIVGDLPPMYLDTQAGDTIKEILVSYADLAEDWIRHVKDNKSLDDCYPFNAAPTLEMADLLERRVSIIKNSIVPDIEDLTIC